MTGRELTQRDARLALALLLVGGWAHHAWVAVPTEWQADVWNAGQGALMLMVLAVVWTRSGRMVRMACALLGVWAFMQMGCSIAYMVAPWPVAEGQAQCSAALNLPLGMLGLVLLAVAAGAAWERSK